MRRRSAHLTRRRLLGAAVASFAVGVGRAEPVRAAPASDRVAAPRPTIAPIAAATSQAAAGSILATSRLVTYYGNPWAGQMGILGQLSKDQFVDALRRRAAQYEAIGGKPVHPAIHMVVTVAQGSPGDDGLYRARMPASVIREYVDLARANELLFVADVQAGRSTVADEIAAIEGFLAEPHVHLALDPEFNMWGSQVPGQQIGHLTAAEVNHGIAVMARLAAQTGQRKILLVHQFLASMLPDKGAIGGDPSVDLAIVMDGYGGRAVKIDHYNAYVRDSAIPFGGIKLFFDWDIDLMSPTDVLVLTPPPDVVVYQ